jgi:hypothetical protein
MSTRASLTLLALTLAGHAQAPVRTFDAIDYGSMNGGFGNSIAALGDMNADGYGDLAVAARAEYVAAAYTGRVRVISGFDGAELLRLEGFGPWSLFGSSVAGPGDVDRDGVPDILVGAPGDDFTGTDSGAAWLYSGRDGSLLSLFVGSGPLARYGTAVAAAGNVNGDAFPDLAVGAQQIGYVDVLSGRDGSLLYRAQGAASGSCCSNYGFGFALASAGDQDDDGLDDLAVGEPVTWTVHLLMGPQGSSKKSIQGGINAFGLAVARIGDTTGDGRSELVIGTSNNSGLLPALAFVWDPWVNELILEVGFPPSSPNAIVDFGVTVAGPGDMDGDSIPDFVVGSPLDPFYGPNAGAAYLYSGRDGALLWRLGNTGDPVCDRFGSIVAAAGDVNGDGFVDLAARCAATTASTTASRPVGASAPRSPGSVTWISMATTTSP